MMFDPPPAPLLLSMSAAMPDGPAALLYVTAVFVLAGLVKGVVGLGLPTVSMALLALAMPTPQAAALLIVPSLLTNLWQMRPLAGLRPLLPRLWPMQAGVAFGTLAGAWWLGAPSGQAASAALGLALVAYAGWSLFGPRLEGPPARSRWLGPLAGTTTGIVSAATGVFVVPAVPYLQALRLPAQQLMQAMGLSFTVSTVALAAGLGLNAGYGAGMFAASVLMLAPAIAGMWLGRKLRQRLSAARFRQALMWSLVMLGTHMIVKSAG